MPKKKKPKKIRVAIAGAGAVAGELYRLLKLEADNKTLYPTLGDYSFEDIEIRAYFDIDKTKTRKLAKEVFDPVICKPWETYKELPESDGAMIFQAPHLDALPSHFLLDYGFEVDDRKPCEVVEILKKWDIDILVCAITTFAPKCEAFYMEAALKAGVHFINLGSNTLAYEEKNATRFRKKNLCAAGDNIRDLIGADYVNRLLIDHARARGLSSFHAQRIDALPGTHSLSLEDPTRGIPERRAALAEYPGLRADPNGCNSYVGKTLHKPGNYRGSNSYIGLMGNKAESHLEIDLHLRSKPAINYAITLGIIIRAVMTEANKGHRGFCRVASEYCFKIPSIVPIWDIEQTFETTYVKTHVF